MRPEAQVDRNGPGTREGTWSRGAARQGKRTPGPRVPGQKRGWESHLGLGALGALTRRSPCSRAGGGPCPEGFAQPGPRGHLHGAAPRGSAAERSVWRSSLESPRSWQAPRSSPKDSWVFLQRRWAAPWSHQAGPVTWGSPGAPRPSAPGLACCRLPRPAPAPPRARPAPERGVELDAACPPAWPLDPGGPGQGRAPPPRALRRPGNRPSGSRLLPSRRILARSKSAFLGEVDFVATGSG